MDKTEQLACETSPRESCFFFGYLCGKAGLPRGAEKRTDALGDGCRRDFLCDNARLREANALRKVSNGGADHR